MDPAMLGLGGVEMIAWQTHHAVEKLATAQEPAHSVIFRLWKIPAAPAARCELLIPMETNETED